MNTTPETTVVDPAALRAAAKTYAEQAEKLHETLRTLKFDLSGLLGDCWLGTASARFRKNYTNWSKTVESQSAELKAISQKLDNHAGLYEAQDGLD